jgi:hypothetical protein
VRGGRPQAGHETDRIGRGNEPRAVSSGAAHTRARSNRSAARSAAAHPSLICAICVICGLTTLSAAELKPQTVAAFDRYVRLTEARIAAEQQDGQPFLHGTLNLAAHRKGELAIHRIETRDNGRDIDIPDGIVHHWIGTVFVPGASVDQAVALLQDYDRHAEIYKPNVARSKVLSRDGNTFRVYLRFFMKQVLTVVVNSEHEARFERLRSDRAASRIVSTRIAEVEDPGTPQEREKPVGNDGGYLWRLNSYWRFLERDGGTVIQCESISLTRGIPTGFGWLIGPFVNSIPRETLTFTLETTRKRLTPVR